MLQALTAQSLAEVANLAAELDPRTQVRLSFNVNRGAFQILAGSPDLVGVAIAETVVYIGTAQRLRRFALILENDDFETPDEVRVAFAELIADN